MKRTRLATAIGIAAATVAGLGNLAACGSVRDAPAAASMAGHSAYSYYRSMMGRLSSGSSGSMMGAPAASSRSWMMSGSGYRWITGGPVAPAWMRGSALPGYMMGSAGDAGAAMGALFASAPGTRVSPARAARLGNAVPAGATASPARNRITFSGASVRFVVLAGPPGGAGKTFRVAGLVDPAIVVHAGARVSIEVINAAPDSANGLVVTASGARSAALPMMTAGPAFPGSAVWFLGSSTSAGLHAGTLTFTAGRAGTYRYLCPVPGQAQAGMAGTFLVTGT